MHAYRHPYPINRYRIAMWVDILSISLVVLHDPYTIPLSSLVYIVIVLGNGMRCFAEALIGSFIASMLTLTLRYSHSLQELTQETIFLNVFGASILIYTYLLMSRVDASRRTLEQTSKVDPLTGLLNRAAFFDTANKAFSMLKKDKKTMVMMFADLDKFKLVNDTHGHQKGDQVLKAVSGILKNNIRKNDIASRYGGDEFVFILKETHLDKAKEISDRIRNEVQQWSTDNHLDIGISIGLGEAPTHGTNIDELLAEVDQQLYKEKRSRLH